MKRILLGAAVALAGAFGLPGHAEPADAPKAQASRQLVIAEKAWTGDFDAMLERRLVRVLVPFSRTLYYNDRGRERGITAELVRDFEQYINRKYAKQLGKRPVTVYLVPVTREELIEDVAKGIGDIAAGNLTVTEARLRLVDFVAPADQKPVAEVVVTGPTAAPVASVGDLAGRTVHVRGSSSYHESLVALNERFRKEGRPPAKLVIVPDAVEDEDMMEMLNAGLFEAIVVDDWKAKMWAQVLPKIKVNEAVAVREGGRVGWAFRKESPKLQAELEAFYRDFVKKQGVAAVRLKREMSRVKQIKNNATDAEWKRFEEMLVLFRKYGEKYNFDPLMLAAQGFQESGLNQGAKSHVGAIGVMQIMPATGAELRVGDITITEPNIHAGAKYMDQLMTRYFKDANFSEGNRPLFAFASYNAGPGRISQMRKEAEKRGLDPNKWFNNVELVTAEKVGIETTTYVRNIYKYYVSYKLAIDVRAERDKARQQVAPVKN